MKTPSLYNFFKLFLFFSLSLLLLLFVYGSYIYLTLPDVTYLKSNNPPITSFMKVRAQKNRPQSSLQKIKYEWLALSQIPDMMQKCVILSEDASFWIHNGIDWFEVKQSLKKNYDSGSFSRGGSTITQQVAKNLFLTPQKSIKRKMQEWMISILLEKELNKKRILELYLNIVEWGSGIYGIKAASIEYFQKQPSQLELFEMVKLAAVLPKPLHLAPNNPSKELIWRSKVILNRLKRYHYIDDDHFNSSLFFIENS